MDFERILRNVGYEGIFIALAYIIIPFIIHEFLIQDREGIIFNLLSKVGLLLSVFAVSVFVFIYFTNIYFDSARAMLATLLPFAFGLVIAAIYSSELSFFATLFWILITLAAYIYLYDLVKRYFLSEL